MSTSTHAAAETPKVEISDLHKFFGELHVQVAYLNLRCLSCDTEG